MAYNRKYWERWGNGYTWHNKITGEIIKIREINNSYIFYYGGPEIQTKKNYMSQKDAFKAALRYMKKNTN